MATLTVQSISRDGIVPSYAAASAGGDQFANDGQVMFHVKNGDASNHTATFTSQVSPVPVGTSKTNLAVIVSNGSEAMIGPFPKSAFNDSSGNVQVTYDAVTSVTVAAIKLVAE